MSNRQLRSINVLNSVELPVVVIVAVLAPDEHGEPRQHQPCDEPDRITRIARQIRGRVPFGTDLVQIRIRTVGKSPWKRLRFIETQCFESSKPRYIIALQQVAMYLLVADEGFSLSRRSISEPLAVWIRSFRNRRKAVPLLRSRTGGASPRASIWRAAARQSEQWQTTAMIGGPKVSSRTLPQMQDDLKDGSGRVDIGCLAR